MADIREITDFSAPELDIFARLKESRLTNWECEERGIFIAESPKVIGRAMAAGYEPVSFLMERRHVESQGKALLEQCADVPVFTAEEKRAWLDKNTDVICGSDAFFPFSDNIERAHKSGVKYIAQPGGSVRDDAVIECADKYDMVMAFTGIRLFHH